ncbi:unnamed protein product, partial [Effrenium voratum]
QVQRLHSQTSQQSQLTDPTTGANRLSTWVSELGVLEFPEEISLPDKALQVAVETLKRHKTITYEDIVESEGVKQSVYLDYLKSEIDTENAFLELPLTILVLVSFAILAMNVMHQEQLFALEEAIERDLIENANFAWSGNFGHKGLEQVSSIEDFWSFMRLGLLGLVVKPVWLYSESPLNTTTAWASSWLFPGYDKPAPVKNEYLHYAKLVSGVRMRQQIAAEGSCIVPNVLDPGSVQRWLAKPCFPSDLGLLTPEVNEAENFENLQREEFLFPDLMDKQDLMRKILEMEDGCNYAQSIGSLDTCRCSWCKDQPKPRPWVDEETARVEISMVLFNPQYGSYTYVSINFVFNRGGHVYAFIHCLSAFVDFFMRPVSELAITFIAALIWFGALAYATLGETQEIISTVRNSNRGFWRAIRDDYVDFYNVVDWLSIIIGTTAIAYYIRSRLAVAEVNNTLPLMIGASLEPGADYQATAKTFFLAAESMSKAKKDTETLMMFYPLIIMMRLFRSFEAQPRLAIVSSTLRTAAADLAHFFMIFACVYLCFVVSSLLFFGQDLESFSTLDRALHSCFLAMFGDWDWHALSDVGMVRAAVWFWLFMIVMVLFLLNMLLAIIMDAYQMEKYKASDATTLWQQIRDLIQRRRQYTRGERVRLSDVWNTFRKQFAGKEKAMLSSENMISVEFLVKNVTRMPYKQAYRTLVSALERDALLTKGFLTEEQVNKHVEMTLEQMDKKIQDIKADLDFVADKLDFFDRLQAAGDAEYDFYFGAEGHTPDEASRLWIHNSISKISLELQANFAKGLQRIGTWQDEFECEQTELNDSLIEFRLLLHQLFEAVQELSSLVESMDSNNEEPQ